MTAPSSQWSKHLTVGTLTDLAEEAASVKLAAVIHHLEAGQNSTHTTSTHQLAARYGLARNTLIAATRRLIELNYLRQLTSTTTTGTLTEVIHTPPQDLLGHLETGATTAPVAPPTSAPIAPVSTELAQPLRQTSAPIAPVSPHNKNIELLENNAPTRTPPNGGGAGATNLLTAATCQDCGRPMPDRRHSRTGQPHHFCPSCWKRISHRLTPTELSALLAQLDTPPGHRRPTAAAAAPKQYKTFKAEPPEPQTPEQIAAGRAHIARARASLRNRHP